MESDTYLTLHKPSEGLYKEKGSKFLAFAYPVSSEEEIKEKVGLLKKSFHDARHHCFAYLIDEMNFRAYDDGEPNHSAGDPILGQIRSFGLTMVLIVVVRYFGGTKLGVGGLVNAYKTAAASALENAQTVLKHYSKTLVLSFPYEKTNEVLKLCHDYEADILAQDFDLDCKIKVAVRLKHIVPFESKFQEIIR